MFRGVFRILWISRSRPPPTSWAPSRRAHSSPMFPVVFRALGFARAKCIRLGNNQLGCRDRPPWFPGYPNHYGFNKGERRRLVQTQLGGCVHPPCFLGYSKYYRYREGKCRNIAGAHLLGCVRPLCFLRYSEYYGLCEGATHSPCWELSTQRYPRNIFLWIFRILWFC